MTRSLSYAYTLFNFAKDLANPNYKLKPVADVIQQNMRDAINATFPRSYMGYSMPLLQGLFNVDSAYLIIYNEEKPPCILAPDIMMMEYAFTVDNPLPVRTLLCYADMFNLRQSSDDDAASELYGILDCILQYDKLAGQDFSMLYSQVLAYLPAYITYKALAEYGRAPSKEVIGRCMRCLHPEHLDKMYSNLQKDLGSNKFSFQTIYGAMSNYGSYHLYGK